VAISQPLSVTTCNVDQPMAVGHALSVSTSAQDRMRPLALALPSVRLAPHTTCSPSHWCFCCSPAADT
jgi:hypothetical protein